MRVEDLGGSGKRIGRKPEHSPNLGRPETAQTSTFTEEKNHTS